MHHRVTSYVSAVLLIAGCGGAARNDTDTVPDTAQPDPALSGVAFSDAALSFATSTPVPSREPASESECAAAAECQRACEAGQLDACTRWGDLLHGDEPARAAELWLDACQRRDGNACLRMMALAAAEPRTADAYARHACAYGAVSACELLGMIALLRGFSSEDAQRAAFLRDAAEVYEMGCGFEDWQSCLSAGHMYRQEELADQSSRDRLFTRGFELASGACEAGDVDACLFRGQILEDSNALEKAKESYALGCRAFLERASAMPYDDAIREPPCRRASELAVAPPPGSVARAEPSAGSPIAGQEVIEARRISGRKNLPPSMYVRVLMQKQGISRIDASAKMCLSSSGLVTSLRLSESSGFPTYDLALLDAMRMWRYSPYLVDGEATPVCTSITFVYTQGD